MLVNRKNLIGLAGSLALLVSANVQATPMLDFLVVMDASGSVGTDGWALEQNYVNHLVARVLPAGQTNIGIVRFASLSTTLQVYNFSDDQSTSVVTSFVSNLAYTRGFSYIDTALNLGLDMFDQHSNAASTRRMLLLTEGDPNPLRDENPCGNGSNTANRLFAADIEVFVGTFGAGPNPATVDCLVDDPDAQIFSLDNYDSAIEARLAAIPQTATVPEPGVAFLMLGGMLAARATRKNA